MAIRSTSGISVSVCQTVAGACPEILVSAAIMSRSRLRPGRRTTADFIWVRKASGFRLTLAIQTSVYAFKALVLTAENSVNVVNIALRCHHVTPHHVQFPFRFGHILTKLTDFVMYTLQKLEHQIIRDFRHQ